VSLPALSIVVPVRDEAPNVVPLVDEIVAALGDGEPFEIVYVDDGSTDETPQRLLEARARHGALRVIRHRRSAGQSAAIATGVHAAHGEVIVTLDGDGQNDPADIPALLRVLRDHPGVGLVTGWRVRRRDSWSKRAASRIANAVRGWLLGDGVPDTGCGLKVMPRAVFLRLPYFDHMHRFLPALVRREGLDVMVVPVSHRPRAAGTSKYGNLRRALVGVVDLLGVMWLRRRRRCVPEAEECSG
jgi:dolichol-phosphate mannosyltransferase